MNAPEPKLMGIYYDEPCNLKKAEEFRAVVGILVEGTGKVNE